MEKICSVCGVNLIQSEIDHNDFYPACFAHKIVAQARTEHFFKENPDYTKWHLIGKGHETTT